MNMQDLRTELMEGCYHEMGHVLAALHYFPNEDRIEGITFTKNPNGSFGFNTTFNSSKWPILGNKEALIMCCIGGGIFQQMKMLYGKLKKHSLFNILSYIRLHYGLRKYLIGHIQCPYEGMEVDLDNLNQEYRKRLQCGEVSGTLNLEEEKERAVDLFMPYLENKKVDKLCEYIVYKILEHGNSCNTIIGINEIRAFLEM